MTKDLNHSEKAALEKLRKLQSQWPGFRWVLLLLGISNILNGLSSYFRHGDHAFGLLAFFIASFQFRVGKLDLSRYGIGYD